MKLSIELLLFPSTLIIQVMCWKTENTAHPETRPYKRRDSFVQALKELPFQSSNNYGKRGGIDINKYGATSIVDSSIYDDVARNVGMDWRQFMARVNNKILPSLRKQVLVSRDSQPRAGRGAYDESSLLGDKLFRKMAPQDETTAFSDLFDDDDVYSEADRRTLGDYVNNLGDYRPMDGLESKWSAFKQPLTLLDVLRQNMEDYDQSKWDQAS